MLTWVQGQSEWQYTEENMLTDYNEDVIGEDYSWYAIDTDTGLFRDKYEVTGKIGNWTQTLASNPNPDHADDWDGYMLWLTGNQNVNMEISVEPNLSSHALSNYELLVREYLPSTGTWGAELARQNISENGTVNLENRSPGIYGVLIHEINEEGRDGLGQLTWLNYDLDILLS